MCDATGRDGSVELPLSEIFGSMGGDMEWDGFKRKLILLLLEESDMEGEVEGGNTLPCPRLGEAYGTLSAETGRSNGE